MKRITSIILSVVLTALTAREAAAQWNVSRFGDQGRNRMYTTFGLDPAFVGSMGYGRAFTVMGHNFQVSTEAGMATAKLDANDYRARLGAQTPLVNWRSLYVAGSATFITRGTQNDIYSGFNFGSDLTGTAGVYRHRWFTAGEFGFDKAIITHVTNSDWYKEHYYPDAKDGWYLDAGGTYHTGIVSGVSLGSAELVGRFGVLRTERFEQMMPPMYASVGLGVGF